MQPRRCSQCWTDIDEYDVTARHLRSLSLAALAPAFVVALVYVEAFLASRALGNWPIPSLEDPKGLVTAPLHLQSRRGCYPRRSLRAD
jgi:hypothetical protein